MVMKRVAIFGATSAIAQAVARRLAGEGARLFLVGRRRAHLDAIAADLSVRCAAAVEVGVADLTDRSAQAGAVDDSFAAFGGLDGVLLAYGSLPDQAKAAAEADVAAEAIAVNFVSAATLLTLIANRMERQGAGTIAVIGSVAGDRGRQSNYVYGSAKAGLAAFTGGLRHRLWPSGVKVVLVKPGFVDTPMTADIVRKGALWATPDRVAADILKGMRRGSPVVYTPWFWTGIMAIVRNVPDALFRKTRL